MFPPKVIKILSDNNELELTGTTKTKDGNRFQYTYTKSKFKKGMVLELSENDLNKLISINT